MAVGFESANTLLGVDRDCESRDLMGWRCSARRMLAAVALGATAFVTSVSFASTTTVTIMIDADNSIATGCSVATSTTPFVGVDKLLVTTTSADGSGYSTQSITAQDCVSGSTFSTPYVVSNTPTPIAPGNGVAGLSAVETYIPNFLLPAAGKTMRVGVITSGADGVQGADYLLLTTSGQAILVDGPLLVTIPALSIASLALTALLIALGGAYARRRGWVGMQLAVVCAVALTLSGTLIAAVVRDGLVADWSNIAPVAIDPSGDAPVGTDVTNFYSVSERENVFFRVDIALNSPPVATAQSVIAVAAIALPITLTGSDYEAAAITYALGTGPTHGVLTGTAPNVTYTASAGYSGSDSFTFKVNDGQLDSTFATVTIDVKLPPTITSVNSAVFIPSQLNSFTFTATGVPSSNFALSGCTLPATLSVTNNSNNTGTLSGTPTAAQGGTYVCTLTATNGYGTPATQTFTLNVGLPPTFASAVSTTFTTGTAGSFTVATTATPATSSITQSGTLPNGVTFTYNGPGTPLNATLSGTPGAAAGGTYPITLTAANGIAPNTVQNFVLTVNQAPAIISGSNTICTVGAVCSFTVSTSGFPKPAITKSGATLPSGMTFTDNGDGTGTLAGTPTLGTGAVNTYAITFSAANGVGTPSTQDFTLSVIKASQTISFTSIAPVGASVGGATYAVTGSATSALAPVLTVDAAAASVCSMAGSTVSFIGVGTCVLDANQSGNADYNAAVQVQQSFAVVKANQTISFISTAPVSAKVSGATYTVSAAASPSGLPVTFAVDPTATSVCSVSGATVSFIGAGTCTINANQLGNAIYNAAPQVQQSFTVAKGDQTISFNSTAPISAVFGGATYFVTATATSGLAVSLSIDPSATTVCSIFGSTVSFIGAGTCRINANQAGNTNYNIAVQVQQSFVVAKASQTITYTSIAPTAATVGGATYTVTATASSGLAAVLTIDTSASSVCSISGSTVSFIGSGTCVVDANQTGNTNYFAAPQVQQSFTVKQSQTINFTSSAPVNAVVGGATYAVTATATSGLTVALTVDALASAVCTISGSTVSFIGAGTCVIDADQIGNASYYPASQVQQSFTVKNTQTVTFTSTAPAAAVYLGATYSVAATATSALTVSLTIDPSASTVCSISGSTVSLIGTGTCVINADQGGNTNYYPAPQVQQSFTVGPNLQADSYNVVGNTQHVVAGHSAPTTPFTATPTALLGNDTADVAITLTAVTNASTTGGGSITIDAAGKLTYSPPVGQSAGSDTYVYTGTANGISRTATITFNISNIVWYVDNASGAATHDGRSQSPFLSMGSGANNLGSALANGGPATGAYVYVHTGSGSTAGAYTFKASQTLIGAGATLSVGALTISGSPANTPTLSGTLTLANSVTINGIDLSTAGATGISSTGATGLNVTVRNLTTTTGTGVNVSTSTGTLSFSGLTTNGGTGANLVNNTGATFNFSGVAVSSGSVTGFSATGAGPAATSGGTINITGATNTLTSTTGTALNVANTTIGASGLTFRSISSNGAVNGIVVNNTGASGGLTITGNGGSCTSAANCTGGAIQNSIGDGVVLTSTLSPSLTRLNLTDSAGAATDDGIVMTNVTGTVTIDSSAILNSPHNSITVDNNNTNMTAFNLINSTISCAAGQPCQPSGSLGNDGLLLVMRGTSVLTNGVVSGSTFSGLRAVAVQIQTNDTGRIGANSGVPSTFALDASNSFIVQNNTFTGNGQGVDIGTSQVSNMTFQVLNNTLSGSNGNAINTFSAAGGDTGPTIHSLVGKIDNNVIGTLNVKDSGSQVGNGVQVTVQGQSKRAVVTVSNNTIREVSNASNGVLSFLGQSGMAVPGSTTAKFKITGNTLVQPTGTTQNIGCGPNVPCVDFGLFVMADEAVPVCSAISNNAIYDLVSQTYGVSDIYLAQRVGPPAGSLLTVEGTSGGNATFIQANNTLAGAIKFTDEGSNTLQVGIGACGTFP